jgi:K+-transporting ATPase ATPase A chain
MSIGTIVILLVSMAMAFIRGIARRETETIGNFWVDFVRCNLYVLLPICVLGALLLVSQGVIQNLHSHDTAKLVEPQTIQVDKKDASGYVLKNPDGSTQQESQTVTDQTIAQGPVASQEFIKMLGTNGGGFFNTNSAHPFENPTPFTNLIFSLLT